jgi:hypothetical protein
MVRLSGCDGGGETTVLAHYSLAGISGRGFKSPDLLGAWCCYPCHQACDGARIIRGYSRDQIRLALAEGMARTIAILLAEGRVTAK